MLQYVADNLLTAAKRRGRIPDAAFSTAELLQIANEEIETYLAPLIIGAQEDYYQADVDFALSGATATYRVPSRAVGNALREISFLGGDGQVIDVPRIAVDDLEQAIWGVKLQSQSVTYINKVARAGPVTLRMTCYLAPNMLCQAADAAQVSAVNGLDVTLAAIGTPAGQCLPVPATTAPTSFGAPPFTVDVIKGTPGFEILSFDQVVPSAVGSVYRFPSVAGIEVGDYVALAHFSPVPQIPTVLWGLLAQSIAAALLGQMGSEDAEKALMARALMEKQVLPLIQNRVRGAPQCVNTRKNILSATRRW